MDRGDVFIIGLLVGVAVGVMVLAMGLPNADESLAMGICSVAGYDEANEINDAWYCISGEDGASVVSVDTLIEYLSKYKED